MRTLVVAAHPDDEVLGCGGTIVRLSKSAEVHVAILGEGLTSRQAKRKDADDDALRNLADSAREVGVILGARSVTLQGLPDNRFDDLPLLEVVKLVEHLIDEFRPEVIYTHHPGDLNIDHQITFRAVLTATRPTGDCHVRELYTFEVPSSTDWAFQRYEPVFRPNAFMDISSSLDTKLDAMQRYSSEARDFPHPRSSEALRANARRWGSIVGLEYAEAFEIVRSIRV